MLLAFIWLLLADGLLRGSLQARETKCKPSGCSSIQVHSHGTDLAILSTYFGPLKAILDQMADVLTQNSVACIKIKYRVYPLACKRSQRAFHTVYCCANSLCDKCRRSWGLCHCQGHNVFSRDFLFSRVIFAAG